MEIFKKIKNIIASKIFRLCCGILILIYCSVYLFNNKNVFYNIRHVHPFYFLLLIFAWISIYLLVGYRTKIFLGIFGIRANFKEWFGTTVIATMSNYLVPQSGIVVRGSYFKLKKQMPLSDFLTVQYADFLLTFITRGALGLCFAFFLAVQLKFKIILATFFLISIAIGFLPVLFKTINININIWFIQKIREVVRGLKMILQLRNACLALVILSLVESLIFALWYFIAYEAIGIPISFLNALVLGLLMKMVMLVPITPGNLGIQEIAIATYSGAGNLGFNEGLMVSFVLRGVSIIMSFSLGFIFTKLLFVPIRSNNASNVNNVN